MTINQKNITTPLECDPAGELRSHAVRGSGWMIAWRLSVRVLSIISTYTLVRLLTPADFGIYAMAMLVVQLIEIAGETGQGLALIRIGKPIREHFDTAWTIQVIAYLVLAVCVVATAPLAGWYFHSHQVEVLVAFLSLRLIANAFVNIGIVSFRIDLNFAADFRFGVYQKALTITAGIIAAVILRSYWALAVAVVMAKVIAVGLSYTMSSYRPRFCLTKFHELWNFSFWMLIVTISEHFAARIDEFVVGTAATPRIVGAYNIGVDLATTPTVDLVEPIMRALFPLYSRLLDSPERLRRAAVMALGGIATLCLASGVGMALIARDLVPLFLGSQWFDAEPIMFWLALGSVPIGLNYLIYTILSVTGNARLIAITIWMRIALLLPGLVAAAYWAGVVGVAAARAMISVMILLLNLSLTRQVAGVRSSDIAAAFYRPCIAALIMAAVLELTNRLFPEPTVAGLLLKIFTGALTYTTVLLGVWRIAGRPDGIEELAMASGTALLRNRIGPRLRRQQWI